MAHRHNNRFISAFGPRYSIMLCLLVIATSGLPLLSQPRIIDSLKALIHSLPPDTSRVIALNRLAFELRGVSPLERERYGEQALVLARTLDYPKGVAQALTNLGGSLWERGHYAQAIGYQERAVALHSALQDKPNLALALNSLGLIYSDQGNYSLALEHFLHALKLREEINDKRGQQITISNIGTVYQQQGDIAAAQEYYFKALKIAEEINDKRGTSIALANIGGAYFQQGAYDNALEYDTRALRVSEMVGSNSSTSYVLNKIGLVLAKMGKVREALTYQERAYKTALSAGNSKVLAHALHGMASAYQSLGRNNEALVYAQQALDTAKNIGLAAIIKDASQLLASVHAAQGRYKEAFEAHQQFKQMSDSAQNLESRKRIANLETSYKLRQQEIENERLQAQFTAQRAETQQQRILTFAVLVGLILVIVLAIVLAQANNNKKRDNTELHRQQSLLEEQAQEIEITNTQLQEQNIALQELNREKNEFLGIAAHDLKNPLASIVLTAQLLHRKDAQITSEARLSRLFNIEQVAARMQEIIANLLDVNAIESGGITLTLSKQTLSDVAKSVTEEYRDVAAKKRITLHFSDAEAPSAHIQADAGRLREVLENLISNAVKYSFFDANVFVTIEASIDTVRCTVADEGPGISNDDKRKLFGKFARLSAQPTAGEHSTGLGLSIVKKLVEMMHGNIWCESELGKGAAFTVEFPRERN
jgi:signal transduction histidine kinase/Tfp pilus assembly protein PilF